MDESDTTEEELRTTFFNDVLTVWIEKIGIQGIIEELTSYCRYYADYPPEDETLEQQESWKRDYEKLKGIQLEN